MDSTATSKWFGKRFSELHPLLQRLHLQGGELAGNVDIQIGSGFGKIIGSALARKFSIPSSSGSHAFKVTIFHNQDGLHWNRSFGGATEMNTLFIPVGTVGAGYWIEKIGPFRLALTVDIIEGGWHWRCMKIWMFGIRIPKWLFPKSRAFKRIEDGRYRFYVNFSLPGIGMILCYSGLLSAASTQAGNFMRRVNEKNNAANYGYPEVGESNQY